MRVLVTSLAALLLTDGIPQEKHAPGLALTFEGAEGKDVRHARLAALHVPAGTAPTPFLPPGPFRATFEGFVLIDIGTDVVFSAEGRGAMALSINGAVVLEAKGDDFSKSEGKPVRLRKGRNALVARYQAPTGDAQVRLFWATPQVSADGDWSREPIPPRALAHDTDAPALREARRLREGRELVASLRCTKCHAPDAKGMPELEMDAPSLADAGARLNARWMASWILNPRGWRAEATMPRLPRLTPQDAADMTAYLATLGKAAPDPEIAEAAAKEGGPLFAEMRCVGCHTLPDKDPAPGRVPLRNVKAKWKPAALVEFLRKPDRHYAWIRMPDFRLTDVEAVRLAAFLLSRCPDVKLDEPPPGDAGRGRTWVEVSGCLACHKIDDRASRNGKPLRAIPADAWARGCSEADFALSDGQREALKVFAATDLSSLSREALPEFAERQIAALRCVACHGRDGAHDLWSDVEGETKALLPKKKEDEEFAATPEVVPVIPSLTWAGEKLKPEWMAEFMAGRLPYRPREYLKNLRMPAFAVRAAGIAGGLAQGHGFGPSRATPEPPPVGALADIGLQLSGKEAPSFACMTCHDYGAKRAVGVFEAPGPNLAWTRERLRKEYFLRWMREPLRVEPGTKMPQFAPLGRSQLTEILEGDAEKQFQALWHYLLEGPKIRPPRD